MESGGEGILEAGGGLDVIGMDAEFDYGLGDCGGYACDDSFAAHELGGFGDFDEVVGDGGIDDGDAGDIEYKGFGLLVGDLLEGGSEGILGAMGVHYADEGEYEDTFPEAGNGGG